MIIAIAVLAVVSAVAGYFIPLAGFAGLIVILLLAIYGLMQLRNQGDNQKAAWLEENYEKTGLTPPENWDPESVSKRLDSLTAELRDAHGGRSASNRNLRIAETG